MRQHHPTGLTQSIRASIEVPQLQLSYAPGDVVHGVVKKINIQNLPENVTVVVKLIVRIETQVTRESTRSDGSKSTSHSIGQRTLLESRQHLYRGPASPGLNEWPFAFMLPHQRLPEALSNSAVPPMEVYQVSAPPAVATFPLFVRPRSIARPMEGTILHGALYNESVKTLHLDPEYAGKSLTFRQHMTSVFQRSKLPEYSFTLVVEYPSVIQLEHPDPISFRLRAIAGEFKPSTPDTKTAGAPPALNLVSADIQLSSQTTTDALEGTSYTVTGNKSGQWDSASLVNWADMPNSPIVTSIPTDVTAPNSTFDIGKQFRVSLSQNGLSLGRVGLQRHVPSNAIYPSFQTRHISHIHQIKWKLVIRCAGKNRKISGSAPVTVLGPSEQNELEKVANIGVDGIAWAHRDWAGTNVRTPVMAANVVSAQNPPDYEATVVEEFNNKSLTKA
ncbi:hypothetical protein SCAR479_10524 [Seiridium cardinale]|uniref:Arrestin-like N-terminal domain-containing protein n=1 Tax=Seiridium cardinale TaxID=138064 RepID=A0ABR2XGM3_9PEZI